MRTGTMTRLLAAAALAACTRGEAAGDAPAGGDSTRAAPAAAPAAAAQPEWRPLVVGSSLDAWRAYRGQAAPAGWTVSDGVLSKSTPTEDIITRDQFGDFELEFEWRVSRGGNAGVFYRATEEGEKVYWTGPEYQILDDANARDGQSRLTAAAAVYGLYPSPPGVVRPAGEWNAGRIVARGPHVEHWLNGQKVAEYELWSPDWEAKVKASKFVEWPRYGRAARGHLAIQGDHGGELSIRNMRVRELR